MYNTLWKNGFSRHQRVSNRIMIGHSEELCLTTHCIEHPSELSIVHILLPNGLLYAEGTTCSTLLPSKIDLATVRLSTCQLSPEPTRFPHGLYIVLAPYRWLPLLTGISSSAAISIILISP